MRRLLIVTAVFALSCISLGHRTASAASDVIDQQNTSISVLQPDPSTVLPFTGGATTSLASAQTFMAGVTGTLDRVSLCFVLAGIVLTTSPVYFQVQIYPTVNGLPSGSPLSTSGQFQLLNTPPLNPLDLTCGWNDVAIPPTPQTAGTTYAMVVTSDNDSAVPSLLWLGSWKTSTVDPYPAGSALRRSLPGGSWTVLNGDFDFKTYVEPAPTSREQCKDGGYKNLIDPRTGKPFKNQGQCVSYVSTQP